MSHRCRWLMALVILGVLAAGGLLSAPVTGPTEDKRPPNEIAAAQAALQRLQRLAAEARPNVPELWRQWQNMRRQFYGPPEYTQAAALMLKAPSPLDRLDRSQIPAEERIGLSEEVVAVLGSQRGRHWGGMGAVAISPDGKWLVSEGVDDRLHFWDPATLRQVALLRSDEYRLGCPTFSPDSRILATGGGGVRLWSLAGGEPTLRASLAKETGPRAGELVFSADGRTLAVVEAVEKPADPSESTGGRPHRPSFAGQVKLFDLLGKRARLRGILVHDNLVGPLAISSDGTRVACGFQDKSFHLWTVPRRAPKHHNRGRPQRPAGPRSFRRPPHRRAARPAPRECPLGDLRIPWVSALAFSPDGRTLALGSVDGSLHLWDTGTDKPVELAAVDAYAESINLLAFAPSGKSLVSVAQWNPSSIEVWDVSGAALKHAGGYETETRGQVQALQFAADGKTLAAAVGGEGCAVRVWDVRGTHLKNRHPCEGPMAEVTSVAFTPDNAGLVSASWDQVVSWWDLSGPGPRRRTSPAEEAWAGDRVVCAAVAPVVALWSRHEGVSVWELGGDVPKLRCTLQDPHDPRGLPLWVDCFGLAPDGNTIAADCNPGGLCLWDIRGPVAATYDSLAADIGPTKAVAFSPDGVHLAAASDYKKLLVWDLAGGRPRGHTTRKGENLFKEILAFAPDGSSLAVTTYEADVEVWGVDSKESKPRVGLIQSNVESLDFSPDGNTLAVADGNGDIVLWDVHSGERLRRWHLLGPVQGIAFALDGRHLASANANGTVYIWRLAPTSGQGNP